MWFLAYLSILVNSGGHIAEFPVHFVVESSKRASTKRHIYMYSYVVLYAFFYAFASSCDMKSIILFTNLNNQNEYSVT